ncbi:MAG TPA: alpha/beta fold hydrolase [Dissulfurispiraceae bacterium]|nr:alpha/beta fold hydrolase [Dissulfurispiraceae bacterium]
MKDETFSFKGDRSKPLIVFIHGMGMDAKIWARPEESRVLGGKYPLSILLDGKELNSSFHDLRDRGYPVVAWSQKRPAGPVHIAVDELVEIARHYASRNDAGIILIGHSRGGLIARFFLQKQKIPVKAIITIGTPHKGSSMAKWASFISPVAVAVRKMLDLKDREVQTATYRIMAFLSSDGLREMLPGSELIKSLLASPRLAVRSISIGGTDPSIVKIGQRPLPSILSEIIPPKLLPDELKDGLGDGFVSAESSVFPGGDEHRDFNMNHAGLIFDPAVRNFILNEISSIDYDTM